MDKKPPKDTPLGLDTIDDEDLSDSDASSEAESQADDIAAETLDDQEKPLFEDAARDIGRKFVAAGAILEEVQIPSSAEAPSKEEDNDEKIRRALSFIARTKKILTEFSNDSSIDFKTSPAASTFAFSPGPPAEVIVPIDWFEAGQYTEGELLFANLHERAHFIDMRNNPDAYLGHFDRMKKVAEQKADEYIKSHPQETSSRESIATFFYNELHTLYNCLDDVYVNDLVRRVPAFTDSSKYGKADIASLYTKLGFKDPDQTKEKLHRQLAHSLLRDAMVSDVFGPSIVDERVSEKLDRKILGKTLREILYEMIRPKGSKRTDLIDPAKRYEFISREIEPIFLELLQVALEEQEQKDKEQQNGEDKQDKDQQGDEQSGENQQGEGQQGEDQQGDGQSGEGQQGKGQQGDNQSGEGQQGKGQPGGGQSEGGENSGGNTSSSFDPFHEGKNDNAGQNSQGGSGGDILDKGKNGDEAVKQILDYFKEQADYDKMSEEEKRAFREKKATERFDKKYGVDAIERKEDTRIREQIEKARRDMQAFWKNLVGKAVSYRTRRVGEQKKGPQINIQSVIRHYPDIISGQRTGQFNDLRIYERNIEEREIIDQPERIEVTLLVDGSGSMDVSAGQASRMEYAKRAVALLMYSLRDFNTALGRKRQQTHSKLSADSEVIAYADSFSTVKPFRGSKSEFEDEAAIARAMTAIDDRRQSSPHSPDLVGKIESIGGSTNDAPAFEYILDGITPEQKKALREKKLKKIVFEITDGYPNQPEETKKRIRELAEEGVIVVGFQIGGDAEDSQVFEDIWLKDQHPNVRGIIVGDDIESIPQALMKELSDLLSNIRI